MKIARLLPSVVIACLFLGISALGQETPRVPASEANLRVVQRVDPMYPPMARVANIQGSVILRATITETGDVTNLQSVSGHPILIQAALDAVKQWKYHPFEAGGKPIAVQTTVHVVFALGPTAEKQRKYYEQESDCQDLLQAGRYAEAEAVCNESVKTAAGLPNDLLKSNAYGNAGKAAYHLNKAQVAVEDFEGQLKFAKSALRGNNEELAEIHRNLARAYQAAGRSSEAAAHYSESEKTLQEELKSQERALGKEPKPAYTRWISRLKATLGETLTEHAALLRQMGNAAGAEELDQRASKLAAPSQ